MVNENTGPVTRLVRLPQGHYRRVVDGQPPDFLNAKLGEQLFEDLRFCCESNCMVSDEEYQNLMPNAELYTDACSKVLQDAADKEEARVFHQMFTLKSPVSVVDMGVQTTKVMPSTLDVGVGASKEFTTTAAPAPAEVVPEAKDEGGDVEMKSVERNITIPAVVVEQVQTPEELQQKQEELGRKLQEFGGTLEFDVNDPNVFKGNGVPTLFYTKTRVNPTLVMLTIDYELQVIYMTRNKINRFFPVKLISRLVTNPDIIHEEFREHVEDDAVRKSHHMVLINAANFTDSVAIQFPDPILKDKFVNDLKELKNEIREQSA